MSIYSKMTARRAVNQKNVKIQIKEIYGVKDFFKETNAELGKVEKEAFKSSIEKLYAMNDLVSWNGLSTMFDYLNAGKNIYVEPALDNTGRPCFYIKEHKFSPFRGVRVVVFDGLRDFLSIAGNYRIQITLEQLCEEAEK